MQVMLVFFCTVNEAVKVVISFWDLKSKREDFSFILSFFE